MNISDITVKLTEEDLLSIIKENLKINELEIQDIKIGQLIEVKGCYKKGIKLNFKASLGFGSINDNILKLRLFNIKIGIFPIWTRLVNLVLKKALKNFNNMGISINKGTVLINFALLCNYIEKIDFVLNHINLFKGSMEVEIKNLIYSESKQINKENVDNKVDNQANNQGLSLEEVKEKIKNGIDEEKKEEDFEEKLSYSKIRKDTLNKVPDKYKIIAEYTMLIPDFTVLLYRLMKDKRVPLKTRIIMGTVLTYFASPIDIIPDSIPLIGKVDDLGIGFILIDKIIGEVPEEIVLEHWQGKEEVIIKIKDISKELFGVIGRKNTIKIISGIMMGAKNVKKSSHRKRGAN